MKILLSPAKSLHSTCPVQLDKYSVPCFQKETTQLVSKLKRLKPTKLIELMHISSDLAELNAQRYSSWEFPTALTDSVFQSVFTFNGEAYRGLSAETLTTDELNNAQEKLRILSGLYGILKPLDLMFPYRLEMGTKWEVSSKSKNLYAFWGDKLTSLLNKESQKGEVVVNLASTEYAKAINPKKLHVEMITPIFKEYKNGEYKTVMMYAKHARGKMARHLIQNELESIDQLKLYSEDRYQFDENQSSEREWVFVR
jgi:cytoplasmic iron level regulating protein YaaA (DUF328/UPF0246 family)